VKYVGLVSSGNGLGHSRRLIHLAMSFQEKGFIPKIFASQKQIKNLRSELDTLRATFNFIEISSYGIDGPVWLENGGLIVKPTTYVINSIQECDLIISDNSIWPIKFNNKFVLFGHFNWLDYWSIRGNHQFPERILEVYKEEVTLFKEIRLWFQFEDFKLKGEFNIKNVIPIKLLKYSSDLFFPHKMDEKSAWIAQGTTGLDENINIDFIDDSSLKFFHRETYMLVNSLEKPLVIIGRPGLGTIRDCLAAGIPFIPLQKYLDPELDSNVNNLEKLNLLPLIEVNQFNLSQHLKDLNLHKELGELWSENWQNSSQDCSDLRDQILSYS